MSVATSRRCELCKGLGATRPSLFWCGNHIVRWVYGRSIMAYLCLDAIYVRVYIYVCVYMYMYMYICICIYVYVYVYICIYIHITGSIRIHELERGMLQLPCCSQYKLGKLTCQPMEVGCQSQKSGDCRQIKL